MLLSCFRLTAAAAGSITGSNKNALESQQLRIDGNRQSARGHSSDYAKVRAHTHTQTLKRKEKEDEGEEGGPEAIRHRTACLQTGAKQKKRLGIVSSVLSKSFSVGIIDAPFDINKY